MPNDRPSPDHKVVDYAHPTPKSKPRGAWLKLPVDPLRLHTLLPDYVCCQCLATGNTRRLAGGVPVPLCPSCRRRWKRHGQLVVFSCILAIVLITLSGSWLIWSRSSTPMNPMEIAATVACLTGGAVMLTMPILLFLTSPLIVIPQGAWAKEMWVRFPNREYVRLFTQPK